VADHRLPNRTLRLLREGYRFGTRECVRQGSDIVSFRLAGRPVTLLRGPAAGRYFYTGRVLRADAMPGRVQRTLTGTGTVQGLDGAGHHARKALFLDLVGAPRVPELVSLFEAEWRRRIASWQRQERIVLFAEVGEVLCWAVHAWAGVPLPEREVARRTTQLRAMIDGGGGVGPRYWRGVTARRAGERQLASLIEDVRAGSVAGLVTSPLRAWSLYREDGVELAPRTAAAEVLNVLRPTVAIGTFIVHAAAALHQHPAWAARLRTSGDAEMHAFVQEVRRTAPFFPAVGAQAAEDFSMDGVAVPAGRLLVLDLYGTNHHPSSWPEPDSFDPTRFLERQLDPYELVPQGGGEHASGHRCPGEWATIAIMESAVRMLTREMTYVVPAQDLSVRLTRVPSLPRSGMLLEQVRPAPQPD